MLPIPQSAEELLTASGILFTLIAQSLYIRQIRRGGAAKNFVTMALNTVNDSLLFGAAIATGQGPAAIGVMGAYSFMDILATHQIYKKDHSMNIRRSDGVCIFGCIIGWCALLNIVPKSATAHLSPKDLDFAASIIGSVVNLLAMAPLIRDSFFGKVAPENQIVRPATIKALIICTFAPAFPWLLDLFAYTAAVIVAPKNSIEHWLQPAAVLAIGLLSAIATLVWGFRRIIKSK